MKITIEQQIKEAKRELAMRRKVYPRRVEIGAMTQAEADQQTAIMAAIVDTLTALLPTQQQPLF